MDIYGLFILAVVIVAVGLIAVAVMFKIGTDLETKKPALAPTKRILNINQLKRGDVVHVKTNQGRRRGTVIRLRGSDEVVIRDLANRGYVFSCGEPNRLSLAAA